MDIFIINTQEFSVYRDIYVKCIYFLDKRKIVILQYWRAEGLFINQFLLYYPSLSNDLCIAFSK